MRELFAKIGHFSKHFSACANRFLIFCNDIIHHKALKINKNIFKFGNLL